MPQDRISTLKEKKKKKKKDFTRHMASFFLKFKCCW